MLRSTAFVVVGLLASIAAALADPDRLAETLFRGSWFYSRPLLHDLRVAGVFAGLCLACWPALAALLRRPGEERAQPARGSRPIDLAFAAALVLATLRVWLREDPITGDTNGYLGRALAISQQGGIPALLGDCLSGAWPEAIVHPLYLAFLAPLAEESNRFLDSARLVALAGSVATLLAVLSACRRRGGETAAFLGAALLLTNGIFVVHGATVACESWWTFFAVLACDLATRPEPPTGARRALVLGACIGLAFLTKGTGTLLLVATAAWIAWRERLAAWRSLAPLAAGFALAAAPLIVRNLRRFGDPLYNVTSRRALWLDDWRQFNDPRVLGEASLQRYLATHSLHDVAVRLCGGFVKLCVHLLEACAPLSPRAAFGAPLLFFLGACVVRTPDRRLRGFLAVFLGLWLASFTWFAAVASDYRFLAVLVPIAMPAVSAVTLRLGAKAQRAVRAGSLAVVSLVALHALAGGALAWRPSRFQEAPWNADLREFVRARTAVDAASYVLGPSERLGFDWDDSIASMRVTSPRDAAGFERLLADTRGGNVRFVVVEAPGTRPRFSDDWVTVLADGSLAPARVPEGWRVVAQWPESGPQAIVMERVGR